MPEWWSCMPFRTTATSSVTPAPISTVTRSPPGTQQQVDQTDGAGDIVGDDQHLVAAIPRPSPGLQVPAQVSAFWVAMRTDPCREASGGFEPML